MKQQPIVSVVMGVYNSERHLRQAVESILNQTFSDFEFIIVNDGSTDSSRAILESYDDSRILLLHNRDNIGLTRSLNKGLAIARGDYVARMDADDISMRRRLGKQVAFFKVHPAVGILGTSGVKIDSKGHYVGLLEMPASNLQIRWASLLGNPFLHPTVMVRRAILKCRDLTYDEAFETAQDYDLWTRTLRCTLGANLSEALIRYRLCDGLSGKQRTSQIENHDAIALRTIREQLPDFVLGAEEVTELRQLFAGGDEAPGSISKKGKAPASISKKRIALSNLYLDMFECFIGTRPSGLNRRALQREVAAKVARITLCRPLEPGWTATLKRLTALEPTFIFSFLPIRSRVLRQLLD